jgi:uncharacterized membrane protein YoaK (UPF0700 family)
LVDYLIVIDAERTLLANQLSLAQAMNLQLAASIHLIKALGGGWNVQARRLEKRKISATSSSLRGPDVEILKRQYSLAVCYECRRSTLTRELIVMSAVRLNKIWLSFGLAFVGGYADAAGFLLANSFTGHVTGNLVLAAISIAGADWVIFFRRVLAIALFLAGILFSVALERFVASRPSWSLLPTMMAIEIVLISIAYCALTSPLAARLQLFVSCMSFALGLQNGAFRQAGGIGVHTTYLTGMITDLIRTETEGRTVGGARNRSPDPKGNILCGVWLAFVVGAAIGATMVFHFAALAIFGTAFVLLAMMLWSR